MRIDRAGDLGDAIKTAIASGKPCLTDANIGVDLNPGGAGVWDLPRHGVSRPLMGAVTDLNPAAGNESLRAANAAGGESGSSAERDGMDGLGRLRRQDGMTGFRAAPRPTVRHRRDLPFSVIARPRPDGSRGGKPGFLG